MITVISNVIKICQEYIEMSQVNTFSDPMISGQIICDGAIYTVKGNVHWGFRNRVKVYYRAPEPVDMRLSVSGSGLPFPGPLQAFGQVNSGHVNYDNGGNFEFKLYNPNSYYKNDDIMNGIGQGKILIKPILYLTMETMNGGKKTLEVDLNKGLELRSLTNLPGMPIRSTGRNSPGYVY